MAFKSAIIKMVCFASLLVSTVASHHRNRVFDVTRYGAVADGKTDNSKAFLNAWKAACMFGESATLLIPRGPFSLGPVSFQGPCASKKSPRVVIRGTISAAPVSLDRFKRTGWIEFKSLVGLRIGGGGVLDGKGAQSWAHARCLNKNFCKNRPTSLRLIKLTRSKIGNLTLLNSKGFHMAIHQSDFIQVSNLKILAPASSPNTDGCHISSSRFVDITNILVGTGDDCVSLGPGSMNISISNVFCSPGHGISVGSLGKYPNERDVVGVRVRNCTISNAANGVRIKTWSGSHYSAARDIVFEDIVVKNVSKPIVIDQSYCPSHPCAVKPSMVEISNVLFKNIKGTSTRPHGAHFLCSKTVPCKNVRLEKINLDYIKNGKQSGVASLCSNTMRDIFADMKPVPC